MKTYRQTIQSKLGICLTQVLMFTVEIGVIKLWLPDVWLQQAFVTFILVALFLAILIIMLFGESVVVSDDGIQYKYFIIGEKISWNGFSRIGRYFFREGLFIRYSHPTILSFPLGLKIYGGFPFFKFVPLSSFNKNWRDSELGQQIKQHAPHLFK